MQSRGTRWRIGPYPHRWEGVTGGFSVLDTPRAAPVACRFVQQSGERADSLTGTLDRYRRGWQKWDFP